MWVPESAGVNEPVTATVDVPKLPDMGVPVPLAPVESTKNSAAVTLELPVAASLMVVPTVVEVRTSALAAGPVVSPVDVPVAVTKVSMPPNALSAPLLCSIRLASYTANLLSVVTAGTVVIASPVCPGASVSATTLWFSVGSRLASLATKTWRKPSTAME